MPTINNPRHEKFAQLLALGKKRVDAYVAAGYRNTKHTHKNASELCARVPAIAARVAELQGREGGRVEVTLARLTSDLLDVRAEARRVGNVSAAIRATMGIAELHGYLTDKRRNDREPLQGIPVAELLEEADRLQREIRRELRDG